jgi:hypothetical protein
VLRVRAGFTVADARQCVPTMELFHFQKSFTGRPRSDGGRVAAWGLSCRWGKPFHDAIFFTAPLGALALTVAGIIVLTHVGRASRIKPLPKDSKATLSCHEIFRGMVNFPEKSRSSHP